MNDILIVHRGILTLRDVLTVYWLILRTFFKSAHVIRQLIDQSEGCALKIFLRGKE